MNPDCSTCKWNVYTLCMQHMAIADIGPIDCDTVEWCGEWQPVKALPPKDNGQD